MEQQIHPETPEVTIERLQAALATERARADRAEAELQQVKEAVHAFRVKQEQVARARKAREAAQSAAVETTPPAGPVTAQSQAAPVPEASAVQRTISSPTGTALAEALEHPDTELDERLDRFLQQGLEPDASREWMLED